MYLQSENIWERYKMKKITSLAIVGLLVLSTSAVTNPAMAKGTTNPPAPPAAKPAPAAPPAAKPAPAAPPAAKPAPPAPPAAKPAPPAPPVTKSAPAVSVVVKAPAAPPKPNPTPPYYPPAISVKNIIPPLPTHIQELKSPVIEKAASNFVYQSGSSTPPKSPSYNITPAKASNAQAQLGVLKVLTPEQAAIQLNDGKFKSEQCFGSACKSLIPAVTASKSDIAKVVDGFSILTPALSGQLKDGKLVEKGKIVSSNTFQENKTILVDKDANAKETAKNTNALIASGLTDLTFEGFTSPEGSSSNNHTLSVDRAITQMNEYRDGLLNQGWTCSGDCGTKDGKVTMINPKGAPVNLIAIGRGEVLPTTGGALGTAFAKAAAAGCVSNSQKGCSALFAPMRTAVVTASKPSTLTKTAPSTVISAPGPLDGPPPISTCTQRGDCPPTICTVNCEPTPPPVFTTCRGICGPGPSVQQIPTQTPTQTPTPTSTTTIVNPGTTTTSRLPSLAVVPPPPPAIPTSPSGASSTNSSGSNSSGATGTPTSGVNGTSTSSSSGSTLLPPASGFGSTPSTGGSTSTPTTVGTSRNPTPDPKFKVS